MELRIVIVSEHALERYQQRIEPGATKERLIEHVRQCHQAPQWVPKVLGYRHQNKISEYLTDGAVIFVLEPCSYANPDLGKWVVVSCMPMAWAESNRCQTFKDGRQGKFAKSTWLKKHNKHMRRQAEKERRSRNGDSY